MSRATLAVRIPLRTNTIEFIAPELQPLTRLGHHTRERASHVLPVHLVPRLTFCALRKLFGESGRIAAWTRRWKCPWFVDLAPSGGPTLGPFPVRSEAIAAEIDWIHTHVYALHKEHPS